MANNGLLTNAILYFYFSIICLFTLSATGKCQLPLNFDLIWKKHWSRQMKSDLYTCIPKVISNGLLFGSLSLIFMIYAITAGF